MATKVAPARPARAPKTAPVVDTAALDVLVEAFNAAEVIVESHQKDLDFVTAALQTARVYACRAAVQIYLHPLGKSQYATAAKLAGKPRSTFRNYIDGGLALSAKRRVATDAPTANDVRLCNGPWDGQATAKVAKRAAQPEGKPGMSNTPKPEGESAEGLGLPTGDTAPKVVTFKDVQEQVKALAALVAEYNATGNMTDKERRGLGIALTNVVKSAAAPASK